MLLFKNACWSALRQWNRVSLSQNGHRQCTEGCHKRLAVLPCPLLGPNEIARKGKVGTDSKLSEVGVDLAVMAPMVASLPPFFRLVPSIELVWAGGG